MSSKIVDFTDDTPIARPTQAKTKLTPQEALLRLSQQQALEKAIDSAQPNRLRAMLKALCRVDRNTEDLVASDFLITENSTATDVGSRKRSADSDTEQLKQAKRFKPRFAMCLQCEQEFDVSKNSGEACNWHPGEREAGYESSVWNDHDENCHGRIDDLENDFPEGFVWTCCEKKGDEEEGCETDVHASEI